MFRTDQVAGALFGGWIVPKGRWQRAEFWFKPLGKSLFYLCWLLLFAPEYDVHPVGLSGDLFNFDDELDHETKLPPRRTASKRMGTMEAQAPHLFLLPTPSQCGQHGRG